MSSEIAFMTVRVTCTPELAEILQAELAECGFDGFIDHENGFEGSAPISELNQELAQEVLSSYLPGPEAFELVGQEKQNWNALWESNFPALVVQDTCLVRAEFHQPGKDYPDRPYAYQIVIQPKMSFGTGHHATTRLMIGHQLAIGPVRSAIDIGCGTGILAILAAQQGASLVHACEIEDWSVENAQFNAGQNQVPVEVRLGTIGQTGFSGPYELVLANINKNVLLAEMHLYAPLVASGGHLVISGFLTHDAPDLIATAAPHGLTPVATTEEGGWASVRLAMP